jgi:hypothetical protein
MNCICKDLKYTLALSDRKTMSIYVEPDGSVLVRAPKNIAKDRINAIVDLKRYWIHKSIAEFRELNKTKVERQIRSGEGFLYMGKSHRLKLDCNVEVPLALKNGFFLLKEKAAHNAKNLFIEFYREQGKMHIPQRVEYFRKRMGIQKVEVRVLDLKKRWASWGKKNLNFHWKIMLAPVSVIDYIIVHELAHAMKKNHSPAFWEIVESVMPNYREKKEWLRLNGANLDI